MINSIFYFADSLPLDEYIRRYHAGEISDRTIVLAGDQNAIYKGGKAYGSASSPYDDSWVRNLISSINVALNDILSNYVTVSDFNHTTTLLSNSITGVSTALASLRLDVSDKVSTSELNSLIAGIESRTSSTFVAKTTYDEDKATAEALMSATIESINDSIGDVSASVSARVTRDEYETAQAEMSATIEGIGEDMLDISASIATKVSYDPETHEIDSSIIMNADQINITADFINAIGSDLTVKSLEAGDTNKVYVNSGGVDIKKNGQSAISLNSDGSGSIANGTIIWDTDGDLTFTKPVKNNTGSNILAGVVPTVLAYGKFNFTSGATPTITRDSGIGYRFKINGVRESQGQYYCLFDDNVDIDKVTHGTIHTNVSGLVYTYDGGLPVRKPGTSTILDVGSLEVPGYSTRQNAVKVGVMGLSKEEDYNGFQDGSFYITVFGF